jgi:xylitol oxidase
MTNPPADRRQAISDDATRRTNWSGTYAYRAVRLHRPQTVDELCGLVARTDGLRPLGTGHTFTDLSDGPIDQVSVADLRTEVRIDETSRTAEVPAGQPYATIAPVLHEAGFGLPALASLPHIAVAGSVATATHGSGRRVRNLAAQVSGVELVDGSANIRRLSREGDPDTFPGAVVALGALGVVTRAALALVPTYEVAQTVYLDLPAPALVERFDEVMAAAYSVSCFTRWQDDTVEQVWLKAVDSDPAPPPDLLAGARRATTAVHPVPGGDPVHCNPQLGVPGPWHERLPHFAAGFTPSFGDEIQSEFFVDPTAARDAITALYALGPAIAPALRISEIRYIAADDLWLSPACGRDLVAFHFTWISDTAAVLAAVDLVERALAPFAPVPHWGKVFASRSGPADPDDQRFPGLRRFAELAATFDPDGKFSNDFLTRWHLR